MHGTAPQLQQILGRLARTQVLRKACHPQRQLAEQAAPQSTKGSSRFIAQKRSILRRADKLLSTFKSLKTAQDENGFSVTPHSYKAVNDAVRLLTDLRHFHTRYDAFLRATVPVIAQHIGAGSDLFPIQKKGHALNRRLAWLTHTLRALSQGGSRACSCTDVTRNGPAAMEENKSIDQLGLVKAINELLSGTSKRPLQRDKAIELASLLLETDTMTPECAPIVSQLLQDVSKPASLSGRQRRAMHKIVYYVSQMEHRLPPAFRGAASLVLERIRAPTTTAGRVTSQAQALVGDHVKRICQKHNLGAVAFEHMVAGASADVALINQGIVINYDGPSHFVYCSEFEPFPRTALESALRVKSLVVDAHQQLEQNHKADLFLERYATFPDGFLARNGNTIHRDRIFESYGWLVLNVPFFATEAMTADHHFDAFERTLLALLGTDANGNVILEGRFMLLPNMRLHPLSKIQHLTLSF